MLSDCDAVVLWLAVRLPLDVVLRLLVVVTDVVALPELEVLTLALSVQLAVGLTVGDTLRLAEAEEDSLSDALVVLLSLALLVTLIVRLELTELDADTEGECDWVVVALEV